MAGNVVVFTSFFSFIIHFLNDYVFELIFDDAVIPLN